MNYTQQENCGSKDGFMGKELLMGHCCGFKVSTERIYEGKNDGATEKLKMPTWICERCKTQVLRQEHLACEDISYIRYIAHISQHRRHQRWYIFWHRECEILAFLAHLG